MYLLALQELFDQTLLQLGGYAGTDVLALDGVVLRHVLGELLVGHGHGGYYSAEPLVVGRRLVVVELIDFD